MSLGSFFNLVEIQTKLASMIPFILGTLYSIYRYRSFNFQNFVIMFLSLIAFDMATTTINNYFDYKKGLKIHGDNYHGNNVILTDKIKESTVISIIVLLLLIATLFGITLTIKTNIVVLLIGAISFLVGIFYTFGPIPLSRMPLGEAFSGFFMGFVIIFLSIYIHIFDQNIVTLIFKSGMLSININIVEIIYIFLISVPAIGGIANIMLANNICDLEEDIKNKRFTLPYYIGKVNSLKLFKFLYYIGYIDIIILVILNIAPLATLLIFITLVPAYRNIKAFCERPIKEETFKLAVKTFGLINSVYILLTGLSIIIKYFYR